jgi:hypothetical protein
VVLPLEDVKGFPGVQVDTKPSHAAADGGYVYLPWNLVRAYTIGATALLD